MAAAPADGADAGRRTANHHEIMYDELCLRIREHEANAVDSSADSKARRKSVLVLRELEGVADAVREAAEAGGVVPWHLDELRVAVARPEVRIIFDQCDVPMAALLADSSTSEAARHHPKALAEQIVWLCAKKAGLLLDFGLEEVEPPERETASASDRGAADASRAARSWSEAGAGEDFHAGSAGQGRTEQRDRHRAESSESKD